MATSRRRIFYLLLFGFLFFSLLARLSLTFNRSLDPDEFEHLHASWMVSQGHLPYKDFWENHTPLMYYLVGALIRGIGDGIPVILISRAIFSLAGILILVLTYFLARTRNDFDTSLLAVLILTYSVIFLQKTIEVRPDQLLVLLWLTSLWICISASSHDKTLHWILAGVVLGLAFLFSPKALLCYAAIMLTFLAQSRIRRAFFYTAGFLFPLVSCAWFFYYHDSWKEFWDCVIVQNFTYPDLFWPTYLLRIKNLSFFVLCISGTVMTIRELRRHPENIRDEFHFLIPALFLMLNFLFFMRAPFPQSALLFFPILSIYGAKILRRSLEPILDAARPALQKKAAWFLAFTLSTALLFPCIGHIPARPFHVSNTDQFNTIRFILNFTNSTEPVFDGNSAYIFRPHAFPYSYLSHGVRWRMEHGIFREKISASLRASGCRIMMTDERTAWLPTAVQLFLRENYVRSPQPNILFAGKQLFPKDFIDRSATVRLLVTAKYAVKLKGTNVQLRIDGASVARESFLKKGPHTISYQGNLSALTLQAFTRMMEAATSTASRRQRRPIQDYVPQQSII